jgi:uncharacterized protein (TIGR03067 family)
MRKFALLLAVAALSSAAFAPAPLPRPAKNKTDLERLQGTWEMTEESNGGGMPRRPAVELQLVVAGERMTFQRRGAIVTDWNVTLDVKTKPKALDMRGRSGENGQLIRAVYAFEGDKLRICHNNFGDRPGDVSGARGHCVMIFQRVRR